MSGGRTRTGSAAGFRGFAVGELLFGVFVLQIFETSTLNITLMSAPRVADPRDDMHLQCHFDMGPEELFAVKWYKDGHEFFRYTPTMHPLTLRFPLPGVKVVSNSEFTECRTDRCDLLLTDLARRESSGEYKCEVSSEAPAFRTAAEKRNVTVAALPKEKPRIEDLAESYEVGDHLMARCISAPGDPKPQLSFYINKQQVPTKYVKDIPQLYKPSDHAQKQRVNLEKREVQLRIPLERRHWNATGKMELECASIVPGIPPDANPRLSVVRKVPLLDNNYINNQKLHWPNNASNGGVKVRLLCLLVLVVNCVRW